MRECEVVRVRERERSTHTPTIVSKDTVTAKVIVPIHTSDLPLTLLHRVEMHVVKKMCMR